MVAYRVAVLRPRNRTHSGFVNRLPGRRVRLREETVAMAGQQMLQHQAEEGAQAPRQTQDAVVTPVSGLQVSGDVGQLLQALIGHAEQDVPIPRRLLIHGFLLWFGALVLLGHIPHFPVILSTLAAYSYPLLCGVLFLRWSLASKLKGLQARRHAVRIVEWLENCIDPASAGQVLEAVFRVQHPRICAAAVRACTRLLPLLSEQDAALLTGDQRMYLRMALDQSQLPREKRAWGSGWRKPETMIAPVVNLYVAENPPLTLAALAAVCAARDVEAIALVERLESIWRDPALGREQIAAAARSTLLVLEQERQRRHENATLLRPASDISVEAESLLRPAGPKVEDSPDLLLRPPE